MNLLAEWIGRNLGRNAAYMYREVSTTTGHRFTHSILWSPLLQNRAHASRQRWVLFVPYVCMHRLCVHRYSYDCFTSLKMFF